MPLVRITLADGKPPEYRRAVADGVHRALVETAGVPEDDRFQIVESLSSDRLIWNEGYLGMRRSASIVIVQIVLNAGRTVEVKKALYARIAEHLAATPGIRADDVLISLVEVARENWSFGGGAMSYPPPVA